MPYGVTAAGFVRKSETDIFAELESYVRSNISPSLDTSAGSVMGQILAIVAAKTAEQWEVAEGVYGSQWATASDASLDRVCQITGTTRSDPTYSTVTATVNLDASTTVAAGDIIASVSGDADARFVSSEAVTSTTAGNYSVEMVAEATGPVQAPSGTLTVLEAPIATGVNSITNALDATPGANQEDDVNLRIKREVELEAQGTSPIDAIRADVQRVDNVTDVDALTNRTMVVDANGLPPKSFEVVALGGADDAIAQVIWDGNAAGIEAYGSSSGTATDAIGNSQTVYFSRPTARRVYLEIDVTTNAVDYPADGDAQIAAAVSQFTDGSLTITMPNGNVVSGELGVGVDVILSKLELAVYSVSGVTDVTAIRADFTASPTATDNLAIATREYVGISGVVGIDSADILVTSV